MQLDGRNVTKSYFLGLTQINSRINSNFVRIKSFVNPSAGLFSKLRSLWPMILFVVHSFTNWYFKSICFAWVIPSMLLVHEMAMVLLQNISVSLFRINPSSARKVLVHFAFDLVRTLRYTPLPELREQCMTVFCCKR